MAMCHGHYAASSITGKKVIWDSNYRWTYNKKHSTALLNVLFAVTYPYIYLSRPYLCQEHTPVLGIYCFLYYFQQKISQAP